MIAQNPGNIIKWLTDHEGKLRVAVALDGVNRNIMYRDTELGSFRTISSTDFRNPVYLAFFTFDNKQLYVFSYINRDKLAVAILDPVTKQETSLIYEHPDFDVKSVHFSRKRQVLTDIEYISWKLEHIFLDSQTEAMFKRLEKDLNGYEIDIVSYNKNEDKFIIRTTSDRVQGIYYLYDLTADSLTKLADCTPWLKEEQLASVKPISYKSRDGLVIHGYLTVHKVWSLRIFL